MTETNFTLDNRIQIGFGLYGFSGAGSQYDGQVLNLPYTYAGTNGTAITTGGQLQCSNMYCHSNGTAIATRFYNPTVYPGPASTSPAWDGSTVDPDGNKCNNCHQYPPSYDRDLPKSNSHIRHIQVGYGECSLCHNATTQDGLLIANKALHANGIYNVSPASQFYANSVARSLNFTYAFDAGGGTCSSNSCHQFWGMADPVRWGLSSITAAPVITQGTTCGQVTFNIAVSGGYPDPAPPYWCYYNWGDGTIDDWSQNCSATHTYPGEGNYNVTWGARDNDRHPIYGDPANNNLMTTPLTITCGPPPPTGNPTAVASYVDPVTNQVIITVTAGALGVERTTISWLDGTTTTLNTYISPGTSRDFPHTYAADGTKNIGVTARTTDLVYHNFTVRVTF
jgi:predicted CxxxxCH...CXXCH cytochrome family protein